MDVLTATINRLEILFSDFENIYFSVSGGKDSSVLIQLANMVALRMGKKFDAMFLDQEAISKHTVEHVNELKQLSQVRTFYHICLPLEEDNACSVFEPQWIMWDKDCKDLWVRPLPSTKDVLNEDNHPFTLFKKGMSDLDFYPIFSDWYQEKHGTDIANVIGIRADESLDRRIFINNRYIDTYKGYRWSLHQSKNTTGNEHIYRFFPLFDWKFADIWACVGKLNLKYNPIYEYMYKAGMKFIEMRICQPFGIEQRKGLHLFAKVEPDTWEKVISRVSGANFGALYAKTKLLGHLKTNKPKHMSWEQYCCFLLESLFLINIDIARWYADKIEITLKYHKSKYNQDITDKTITKGKEYISWEYIAKSLEQNDFWFKRLYFSESKAGYDVLEKIKAKGVKL